MQQQQQNKKKQQQQRQQQQQQQNKKRQQQVLMRPSSNLDPESFHQFTMKTSLNCIKSFDGKINCHKVIFILE